MTSLVLYDDTRARGFAPYSLTRPAGELRAGSTLIRHRWERALGARASGFISSGHLADFVELDAPPATAGTIPAGTVIANTRCVVALDWVGRDADVYLCAGRVAAVRLARPLDLSELGEGAVPLETLSTGGTRAEELRGRWLEEVWSLIVDLLAQLRDDIAADGPTLRCLRPEQCIVLGEHPLYVEEGAIVEPLVCFDLTAGPILVRRGATVRALTRLVGPCAIASGAVVLGDRVHGCSIGEVSFVRGEISESVVLGHANKSHDGFVGHSYLGRWVNLGAGTITSNLKNTYGSVSLWTPDGVRDTGTMKLGTLFGDHAKTGIGLRLTTGSVIGAGANVYGSAMPPKHVPPFSWGEGDSLREYRVDKFLEIAERAMSRRQVVLDDRARRQLASAHALARSDGQ